MLRTIILLLMTWKVCCLTCGNFSSDAGETAPMRKCVFLKSSEPLIQCDIYGVGHLAGLYIPSNSPLLLMRVIFSVKGRANEVNSTAWCLSMNGIELKIVDDYPEDYETYPLVQEVIPVFSAISEFQVITKFPPEIAQDDAFTNLPASCNLYESPISEDCKMGLKGITFLMVRRFKVNVKTLQQVSNIYIVKRQGSFEYLRFLSASRMSTPDLLEPFSRNNFDTKIANMTGNNMEQILGKKTVFSFPKLTKLYLSQCSLTRIHPENLEGIKNIVVFDLSENQLKTVPAGLEQLQKLKELDLSSQRVQSFNMCFGNITSIEKLHLNNLPIQKLTKSSFTWVPGLQYLSLRSCQIVTIEDNTFHELQYLSYLDLSNNKKLKLIFSNTFLHLASSANLYLENNPQLNNSLQTLNFRNINILDLTNCDLSFIPDTTGVIEEMNLNSNLIIKLEKSIHNIKRLNISNNKIATVDSEMGEIFSKLESVDIGENPFDCHNCAQNEFRQFLINNPSIVKNAGGENYMKCLYPHIEEGKSVMDVSYDCYTYWFTIGIPVVFVILCVSILLPVLGYTYRFDLIYMRQLWRMKRRNEECLIENEGSIEFDAFVSYCAADRHWVVDYLLERLEPPLGRYNLCLHERDFQLGNFIMDNIVENIEKSRRVIFVLSNNFLKSEWCKWELRMATHRIFERSNSDFLILLKLELLRHELVPLSLRILLATRTYLEWNQGQSEDFWCRLTRTLGEPLSRPVQNFEENCEPLQHIDEVVKNLEALKNDPEMFEKYLNDLDTNVG